MKTSQPRKKYLIQSIFGMKCPCCRDSNFFVSHPYDLKNAGKTPENCSNCGVDFLREPGFYFGALYISYAFGVALFVTIYVSFLLFTTEFNAWIPIALIALSSVVIGPYFYALSKVIWIHFFVKYNQKEQ